MGAIQRLILDARPSTGDSMQGNDSHLKWLTLLQLQRTNRLLVDFSNKLVLDWHGLIYEEMSRAVTTISTLVQDIADISIPAEAREEHFLEALLDLRWWTWVTALQVEDFLSYFTPYDSYFDEFEGLSVASFRTLSIDRIAMTRRLPSYSFELWQQKTKGRWRGILQSKILDYKLKGVEGENEADMLLNEIRNAELPDFEIKQLGPVKFRDSGKLSSIQDHLKIDLTQDLLGVSPTGYVIKTSFPDGQGGSIDCALKRIDRTDENEPDLARLWHPHIVHLTHHWREKSGPRDEVRKRMPMATCMAFLVMELMDCDLAMLITRIKEIGVSPFSLLVAVDLMLQIAKGMLYLHEMNVSHPHLKCENVLCRIKSETLASIRVGDVLIKLGGFGCSRTANEDTKNRDVICFGLTCLEILTGDELSENISGAHKFPMPSIPANTPSILKHCIASCLGTDLTFSEVVMLLLLAQCQIMQTRNDKMMLWSENVHIEKENSNTQDLASSSRSKSDFQEMFQVHQLHPQLLEGQTSAQMTLIFFHGFPKVSEDWRMTWMTRDNKLVWPQMWLPEDLGADIRVLSVSFDDNPNVSSTQSIMNLLKILVMSATWKMGETEQVIILVGHSFGGLIIKALVNEANSLVRQAVLQRSDRENMMKCERFLKNLASVVFYSVPHALTNTEFENFISECSNTRVLQRSSLLKSLRGDSSFVPRMIELSRNFESAVARKTKVLAFLEGSKPMSEESLLVRENACEEETPSWEWHMVDKDNHFEVCRPDSKSHTGYEILLNHLKQQVFSPSTITTSTIDVRDVVGIWNYKKMNVVAIKEAPNTMHDITLRQAGDQDVRIDLASTSEVVEIPITNSGTKLRKSFPKFGKILKRSRKSFPKFGKILTRSRKDSTKSGKNSRKRDEGSTKVMRARSGNAARSKTEPPFVSLASRLLSIPNFHQVEEVDESTIVSDLITKLSSQEMEVRRDAAQKIRHLTIMNKRNRNRITEQGGIAFLIHHLQSPDKMTQEHAITALRNLCLEENVRGLLMIWTEAIDSIVHVVKFGHSMEARENAAATIQCLSHEQENKMSIGNAGAIPALIELLRVGTRQGKKAAANALCSLMTFQDDKRRRGVETDLINVLMGILHSDPSSNELEEISLRILANLSLHPDGLIGIGISEPIAMLVDFITWGSYKSKELATALLCKLCSEDPYFTERAYECEATRSLAALLRDDNTTYRCKQNAKQILDLLTLCADRAFCRASEAMESYQFEYKGPGVHHLPEAGGRRKRRPSSLW